MDELMQMSLEDLVGLQQKLEEKVEAKKKELKQKVYNDFVNAYRNFRMACPDDTAYVTAEVDDADIEIDLYEYLDFFFKIFEDEV
jgi:molecular chaperone GrpE (heat shock protein)